MFQKKGNPMGQTMASKVSGPDPLTLAVDNPGAPIQGPVDPNVDPRDPIVVKQATLREPAALKAARLKKARLAKAAMAREEMLEGATDKGASDLDDAIARRMKR
jgi:hypothetical protein